MRAKLLLCKRFICESQQFKLNYAGEQGSRGAGEKKTRSYSLLPPCPPAPLLLCLFCALVTLMFVLSVDATPPAPVTNVMASDIPNDSGQGIALSWTLSADDGGGAKDVEKYIIMRRSASERDFTPIKEVGAGTSSYEDTRDISGSLSYYYKVRTVNLQGEVSDSSEIGAVRAEAQWFHTGKKFILIAMLIFSGAVVFFIQYAKRRRELFIRRIAGLEAVDDAVGRATEMGKPLLYILGIGGASDVATIAAMNILGQVARRTAEYDTPLKVPCNDAVVMSISKEIVKTAHLDVGRPDTYKEDNVFFLTEAQFAYAAAVDGIITREKPAAIFLQGSFAAESLILAETGNSAGAIQISGTDSYLQLPFFVAACDYTLIGEELYAASAYLSKEPQLLGAIKGQDAGKLILLALLLIGAVLEFLGVHWITQFLQVPR